MAFVIEDGSGKLDATSYVSVTEADEIIALAVDDAPLWDALDETTKQKRLSFASQDLDRRTRWKGNPVLGTTRLPISALRWPRWGVDTQDGITIPFNVIPVQLKRAVAMYALYLVKEKPVTSGLGDGIRRFRLEPLEVEFQDGARQVSVPADVQYMLADLGIARSHYSYGKILRS